MLDALTGNVSQPPREGYVMASDEQVLERRLVKLRLAGPDLSHTRKKNVEAVERMVAGDQYATFGIRRVVEHINSTGMSAGIALKIVSSVTKCSQDITYTEGRGYISPSSTIKGLKATAAAIKRVASNGGRVVLATGHPGSMIEYYIELADLVYRLGGRVLDLAKGQIVRQGEDRDHIQVVDSINSVAFLSDTCAALHSHDSAPMEMMLDDTEHMPDLVIADHGFAGEAINRGIPTVAVMDTNDPGLALARHIGANVIIVPMNDNRPNVVTREAAHVIRGMALEGWRARR
ncbi:MAG TPA: phosphatase [Chloroflexia bacterium]|nr:phosphatase [Chloroflexia bacterium]